MTNQISVIAAENETGDNRSRFNRLELVRRGTIGAATVAGLWWRLPGAHAAVEERPVQQLMRALRGPVVGRASAAYNQARLLVNRRYDAIRPLALAYPLDASDVAAAITWAQRHRIPLAIRSGGHSYCGLSTVQNGLVLDLQRLNGITTDGKTARIGAGARLQDVYQQLGERGLVVPSGSCGTVGISGVTLGGGHGFYARKYGLSCDNVTELEIVTADGRRRLCNASQHGDLFFACRGGGGNYGVVTSWKFRTHRVAGVSTFRIVWPWPDAEHAFQAWQALAPHAPDELFSVFSFAGSPAATTASCSGQYVGTEPALRRLIEPLTTAGAPLSVSLHDRTVVAAARYWSGAFGRVAFAAKSNYATKPLPATAIRTIISAIEARLRLPGSGGLLLDSYGGAINRVPADAMAFAHRNALFSFQYLAQWNAASEEQVNVSWLRQFHHAMRPFVSGDAYVNYCDPDLHNPHAYYGANLKPLQKIKKRYDPTGLFRSS